MDRLIALSTQGSGSVMRLHKAIHIAAFPIIVLLLLVAFVIVYRMLGLPPSNELVQLSESYFSKYGYLVVFIGAFLEATPIINFYLPGSTVVVLAVAFSRHGTLNVFAVLAVAAVGFLLSYILNYMAGRYGWYSIMLKFGLGPSLHNARRRVLQYGPKWLWIAYVHPNIGAIAATSCGVLYVPFGSFVLHSILALSCWNVVWGVIAYFGADSILKLLDVRWLIPIVVLWVIITIIKGMHKNDGESTEGPPTN